MSKSHNKKRNVGILYEQIINYISQALVEGKKKDANVALKIIKRNFKPGTELYKEFRLFNALVKTSVNSESLATRILSEAKKAAQDHDATKLRSEKSQLIKEINHTLSGGSDLYSRRIKDYTTYATIQTLLNDWRQSKINDFSRTTLYESKIHAWLMENKHVESLEDEKTTDINNLTVKLMIEKFNNRYGVSLNKQQREILKEYSFSITEGDDSRLKNKLQILRKNVLSNVKKFSKTCENRTINEKIEKVSEIIKHLDESDKPDALVSKHLLLSKLNEEIEEKGSV